MAAARHSDFFRPFSSNNDYVVNSRYAGQTIPAPVMAEALSSIWGPGRSREQSSRYQTGFDWKDLMERYEGMPLEWSTDRLTAAMLNERGNVLLDYVAPLIPTDENVVRIIDTEMYQLPYDITAAGGVPRSTTYRREAREYSLQQFKRFQTIELAYLQDKNFGQSAMNDIMSVLSSQAQLTLAIQVSIAIVVIPYAEISKNLRRRKIDFDCARQIHLDAMGFAVAHVSLNTFERTLERELSNINGIDTVIMPENCARLLAGMEGTSRRLPLIEYGYDQKTGQFYRALYEGANSLKSVVRGSGFLDFIENPNYRYSILDSDSETTQTLRSFPVLGEMIMQRIVDVDDIIRLQERELNVGTYDQTDTNITHNVIKYTQALQWCMLWNNRDGTHAEPGTYGDAYNELINDYNADNKRAAVVRYLEGFDAQGRDVSGTHSNNTPSGLDLNKSSLEQMEFRDKFSMASTYNGRVVIPMRLGDISMRFVSNRWYERVARAIVLAARQRYGLSESDLARPETLLTMADTFLPDLPHEKAVDLAGLRRPGPPNTAPSATPGAVPTTYRAGTNVLLGTPTTDGVLEALRKGDLDLSSPLVRALEHVPSGPSLEHYSTFFKAATTEGDASKESTDRVIKALASNSLKAGAKTVLSAVHEHLSSGKPLSALDGKALGNVRELSKGARLDKEVTAFGEEVSRILKSNASSSATGVDAMDIDAPISFDFGAFDENTRHTRPGPRANYAAWENVPTQTGAQRLNNFTQTTSLDSLHQTVVQMIMQTPNTLRTHTTLASKLGIGLMRLNYWRIFERYRMLCISMLRAGERTLAVLFGHQVVTPNLNGAEQYVNIVVQFRAGVVPRTPSSMKLVSYPIADKLLADINTQFVRSQEDYLSDSSHKPSIVVLPAPIDETNYNFPLHIMNKDIYHPSDPTSVNPYNKHSASDLHKSFIGKTFLDRQSAVGRDADIYDAPLMSLISYKSWSLLFDFDQGKWLDFAGNGPRGESYCNGTNSASVWAGVGRLFPENPHINMIA